MATNGLQYTIKKATGPEWPMPVNVASAGNEQLFEIWHNGGDLWLDLEEILVTTFEDRDDVKSVLHIDYDDDWFQRDDPTLPHVYPRWGRYCIFVFGKAGHNIAPDVIGIVRAEYDALQAELENPGYAGMLGPQELAVTL